MEYNLIFILIFILIVFIITLIMILQYKINNIKKDNSCVRHDLNDLIKNHSDLYKKVKSSKDDITDLIYQIDDLSDNLDKLDNKISKLEEKINKSINHINNKRYKY